MNVVVIIPTYNESENIVSLAERISSVLPEAHLLLMDDNSPDGTADIAKELFSSDSQFKNFQAIRREGRRGLGRSYCDGFQRALTAGYDRIIQMDADLSHNPSYLPSLLEASSNSDLVIGSRYCPGGGVRNWSAHRVWLSKFANWYVHKIAGIPVMDVTAGYRCWTSRALKAVQVQTVTSEGYSFQVEMSHRATRAGMKISEVPIVFTDREFGKSKISRSVLLESALMPWKLRLNPWSPLTASYAPIEEKVGDEKS